MGCGASQLADVYERDGVREHKAIFETLAFKEMDIARMHKAYRVIDNDNSGEIELAELLAYLDLERTRFTKRIFSLFDEDNSGMVNFKEFVLSLWNYCTLTRASLTMFAFDLYDKDTSGNIEAAEVKDMLHDLYGSEFKGNPQARLIEVELQKMEEKDGNVSIEDFKEFTRTHPALLFHAFRMQESIQDRVLGRVFWAYYSERRIEISRGRLYVPISEFLDLHLNKNMKDAVVNHNIGLGNDPRKAPGYDPDEPLSQRKFGGKIGDRAVQILESTGSMARRKGKELTKAESQARRNQEQRDAEARADHEHNERAKHGAIDETDRSYEKKTEEERARGVHASYVDGAHAEHAPWSPSETHKPSHRDRRASTSNHGHGHSSGAVAVVGGALHNTAGVVSSDAVTYKGTNMSAHNSTKSESGNLPASVSSAVAASAKHSTISTVHTGPASAPSSTKDHGNGHHRSHAGPFSAPSSTKDHDDGHHRSQRRSMDTAPELKPDPRFFG
jgi:Ca2+-binding EF-hand superfamily protein